jgi:hypothetical protein
LSLLLSQLGGAVVDEGLPWRALLNVDEDDLFSLEDQDTNVMVAWIEEGLAWHFAFILEEQLDEDDAEIPGMVILEEGLPWAVFQILLDELEDEDGAAHSWPTWDNDVLNTTFDGMFLGDDPDTWAVEMETEDFQTILLAVFDDPPVVAIVSQWILRYRRRGRR